MASIVIPALVFLVASFLVLLLSNLVSRGRRQVVSG